MSNTKISYQYRDGTNCKTDIVDVIFPGGICADEIEKIINHLGGLDGTDQDQFIPGQVGLPDIQKMLLNFPIPEVDHVWHVLDNIELTDAEPTINDLNIHQFVKMFCGTRWDDTAHALRLGIYEVEQEDDGEID